MADIRKANPMKGEDRKAAIAAYRERKSQPGIYAIRGPSEGQIWVGSAPDLATIQNRMWFMLEQKACAYRSLQEAWTALGKASFTFEIVEQVDDEDIPATIRNAMLKTALDKHVQRLNAVRI